ncbi:Wzz/FepE/Etk N-terminal domain-containing protein [Amycolatopsis antarctica]|uniref:Wzz/FepE/Etk N-terminal domain-containing protein n=1 Tax=Amycolatopsis antarctica TaxID=1854586 RepID=UPI0013FD8AB7|nr:Wzz/FepE/Etk N-terminal domain-containing protein [Amycolatopsis antarctica]
MTIHQEPDPPGVPAVSSPSVRLADIGGQLRRRWRLIALTAVGFALIALVFSLVRPTVYSSTAVVTVNPVSANPQRTSGAKDEVNMTTERAVIQSTEVIERARSITGDGGDTQDLIDRLTVTSPADSQVLEISATGDDPDASAALANAVARAYLDMRTETAATAADRIKQNVAARIDELTAELTTAPTGPGADGLRAEIDSLRTQQSDLGLVAVEPGRIITTAAPGEAPSLGPLVFTGGGAVGGLLVGVAVALVRERVDGRVRDRSRLQNALSVPVLEAADAQSDLDFLDRVALRIGGRGGAVVTVALLGTDQNSIQTLGAALSTHLRGFDPRSRSVIWAGGNRPEDGEQYLGALLNPRTWEGKASTVLVSPRADVSVARTAMLGREAGKVIVATSPEAEVAAVTRLIGELRVVGAEVDLVVIVPSYWISPARNPSQPPSQSPMPPPAPHQQQAAPGAHPLGPGQATVDIDVNRLREQASRSGGPSGQSPPVQGYRPPGFD